MHLKGEGILSILTKVDKLWPKFDQSYIWASSRIGLLICRHLKEHMKTYRSIVYGLKTYLKRRNYGRNCEKMPNT